MKGGFSALSLIKLGRGYAGIVYTLLLAGLLAACGNDELEKVKKVNASKVMFNTDRTLQAAVVFSDSANVKATGFAPVLDKVTPTTGSVYMEMPKGIKITFYDPKTHKVTNTVTSDYAIRKENEFLTILKRNVVVKNLKNDSFMSEELTWDEKNKLFFSNEKVKIQQPNGNVLEGYNFKAPQDFSTWHIEGGAGQAEVKEGIAP